MDTISIRPPERRGSEPEQDPQVAEQEESRRKLERQRAFAIRAGKEVPPGSPANQNNKRQSNLLKKKKEKNDQSPDFTFVYGMATVWDFTTFIVGLIPVVGWLINAIIIFPIALFNMFIMLQGRGKSVAQFWAGFKYIFIEAVPYLNIIPTFWRAVYLIKNEGKTTGVAGAVNTLNKAAGK